MSAVCAGGAPLGSMPANFGYEVDEARGVDTAVRVLEGPLSFLDTSNRYAGGDSERRIGAALRRVGGLPEGFVLATKADRDDHDDFSGAQVRRSFEQSLERLGVDRIQLLHLHDPEHVGFEQAMAPHGAVAELVRLRDEGLVDHLGVAGGPVDLLTRFVDEGVFDAVLTHNRFTLVDRSADALVDRAHAAGVAVLNAAVLGGGLLAGGTGATTRYAYREADPRTLEAVRSIEAACTAAGVPLAALALQFSVRDPRITSTVVGFSRPERVDEVVARATVAIPDHLWALVDRVLPPTDTWLF